MVLTMRKKPGMLLLMDNTVIILVQVLTTIFLVSKVTNNKIVKENVFIKTTNIEYVHCL